MVHAKAITDQEFLSKLKNKLLEEAKEVLDASSSDELCEELADVLEVVHALSKGRGLQYNKSSRGVLKKEKLKKDLKIKYTILPYRLRRITIHQLLFKQASAIF